MFEHERVTVSAGRSVGRSCEEREYSLVRESRRQFARVVRTHVCVALSTLTFAALVGCQPNFVSNTWTELLVTSAATREPIEGAAILATALLRFDEEQFQQADATDANGRTLLPLFRVGNWPFDGVLTVTIATDGGSETIAITNRDGETVEGSLYSLRIISTDALP